MAPFFIYKWQTRGIAQRLHFFNRNRQISALKGKSHILPAKRWEELLFCLFHALPEIRSFYPHHMGRLFLHRHFLFRCPAISGHHLLSICLFIFFFLSVSFQILSLLLSVPVSEGFPTVPPIFSLWYILIP